MLAEVSVSPASGRRTRSSRAPGRAVRRPGTIAFWIGSLAALLTSFYSWRLIFLTFFGEPRWAASEHIQHALHGDHADHPDEEHGDSAHDPHHVATGSGGYRPHESPLTILVPICLLALGAALAGQIWHGIFIDAGAGADLLARHRRLQP